MGFGDYMWFVLSFYKGKLHTSYYVVSVLCEMVLLPNSWLSNLGYQGFYETIGIRRERDGFSKKSHLIRYPPVIEPFKVAELRVLAYHAPGDWHE